MINSKNYNLTFIPIVTVIVGFLSFLSLSIYYKVFWIDSKYDVPLIYNASIMLGDSILLPTLTYRIFNIALNKIGLNVLNQYSKRLFLWSILMLCVSLIVNIYSHLMWANDAITDFVSFVPGRFSIIGYWHLIYSILQMLILLIFPFVWYIAIKEKNKIAINYSINTWKYLLAFSSLAIVDMLNKYFFIYKYKSLLYALKIDKFAFTTVLLSLVLFGIMKLIERNRHHWE